MSKDEYRTALVDLLSEIGKLSDAYNSSEDETDPQAYHQKLEDAWSELDALSGFWEEHLRAK